MAPIGDADAAASVDDADGQWLWQAAITSDAASHEAAADGAAGASAAPSAARSAAEMAAFSDSGRGLLPVRWVGRSGRSGTGVAATQARSCFIFARSYVTNILWVAARYCLSYRSMAIKQSRHSVNKIVKHKYSASSKMQ
jgi:hypothetical protein